MKDLREVASWITSARECELWAGWRVRFPIDLESLPALIDFASSNAFSLFDHDELAAFGQLIMKEPTRAHLGRIIVAPSTRRRGYGEMLLRELVETARLAGCERISLCVDRENIPAIRLYGKLDFRQAAAQLGECISPSSAYMEALLR